MAGQLAFQIDSEKCIGCFTCAMACKNQHHQEKGVAWRRVHPLAEEIYPHRERAFYSLACNHCEKPVCVKVCPVGAYRKRDKDGVVVHAQEQCIGCGNCVRSCPHGAPQFNPSLKKAEKCSFCWQRLDAGRSPACVQSCPVDALQVVDLAQLDATGLVQYPPGFPRFPALNPSVRFRLPRLPRAVMREDV